MSHKKDFDRLRTKRRLDRLKWETVKELGLEEGVQPAGEKLDPDNLRVEDEKEAVKRSEKALAKEGRRKTERHLNGGS
jgi:hypothetical protein